MTNRSKSKRLNWASFLLHPGKLKATAVNQRERHIPGNISGLVLLTGEEGCSPKPSGKARPESPGLSPAGRADLAWTVGLGASGMKKKSLGLAAFLCGRG